ncbi:hypothetical protein EI94DRAFT_1788187 [Lactarius quietus]|nr:hypothetical protein EI94DRAFT_1788187 [Lactarius quietus]
MLFNKSIVSFFAVIALASSVTASVAPGSQGDQVKARSGASTCSKGTLACCGSVESFGSLTSTQQSKLRSLDHNVNAGLNVGLNCVAAGSTQFCPTNKQARCCDAIQNTADLPGVAANCVNN